MRAMRPPGEREGPRVAQPTERREREVRRDADGVEHVPEADRRVVERRRRQRQVTPEMGPNARDDSSPGLGVWKEKRELAADDELARVDRRSKSRKLFHEIPVALEPDVRRARAQV